MHQNPHAQIQKPISLSEVATRFGVNATTLVRWGAQGRVTTIRSLSGQRRYRAEEIERALSSHAR
ncbi:MAG: hypothetical protein JWO63_534 [Frankiales bacterium]|jgi:predicted site-specific integrase-resolvase|nr:hypothetical protein [Frankiales bacterium]